MTHGNEHMGKNTLILLIQENEADEYLRQILANGEDKFRVQSVERIAMALARLNGGGVDLVILDLSHSTQSEIEMLDNVLKLRSASPQVPIIVVDNSEDDSLIMRAARAGAADYLPRTRCKTDLSLLAHTAIGRRLIQLHSHPHLVPETRQSGVVTTFLGAKGGVGTTTVALNVASSLAQWGKVILTELSPTWGTLSRYFRPHHLTCNIARLVQSEASAMTRAQVEDGLWSYKEIPGLNILFGPQTMEQCQEIAAPSAAALLNALARLADYVVFDLSPSLSAANRAIIQESDSLVVVVERDPLCIESAKPIQETIQSWKTSPSLIGSVIVNRTPLAAPMDLAAIEMQLGVPTLGVIPPAADLCIAAQKAGMPLSSFDRDSLAAQSLISLADALARPSRNPARAS